MLTAPLAKGLAASLLLLTASAGLNVYLLRANARKDAECTAAIEKAKAEGIIAAKEAAAQTSDQLAIDAVEAHAALLRELEQVADRARQTRVVYRQAAAASPLPAGCAPGPDRVDAVNSALKGAGK